jgi:hypothetical protein
LSLLQVIQGSREGFREGQEEGWEENLHLQTLLVTDLTGWISAFQVPVSLIDAVLKILYKGLFLLLQDEFVCKNQVISLVGIEEHMNQNLISTLSIYTKVLYCLSNTGVRVWFSKVEGVGGSSEDGILVGGKLKEVH